MTAVEVKPRTGGGTTEVVRAGPLEIAKIVDEFSSRNGYQEYERRELGNYAFQVANAILFERKSYPTEKEIVETCRDHLKTKEYQDFTKSKKMLHWEEKAFSNFMWKHGYGNWNARMELRSRLNKAYREFEKTLESRLGEHLDATCEDDGFEHTQPGRRTTDEMVVAKFIKEQYEGRGDPSANGGA